MTSGDPLIDWLSICEAKAQYCRLLDTKQWTAWEELFTENYELSVSEESGMVPRRGGAPG
jgi:3-phenylpropionate/cinnamic acid dioxygenase small subunit